jgi:GntR family transcriptional regulator
MRKSPNLASKKRAFFNPFPKYLQLREILRKRLQSDYAIGDRLPTEGELCDEFEVSRETVRLALRWFDDEGLIDRRRSQGTFLVRRPGPRQEQRLTGLSEDYTTLKLDTKSKILESGTVTDREVSQLLRLSGDQVYMVKRVRFFDRKPLALHYAYFAPDVGEQVKRADLEAVSILQFLEKQLNLAVVEERQEIDARVATPELAQVLHVAVGAPILFLSRFFRHVDGAPLVIFRSYYRADRYYYTINIAAGT